ncbi:MAG: hypothetical protein AAB403_16055 [Planctomycetota bacterium]
MADAAPRQSTRLREVVVIELLLAEWLYEQGQACRYEHRSNADVARLIEAEMGMRLGESTLSHHRAPLGYGRWRPNDWTSSLRRWNRGRASRRQVLKGCGWPTLMVGPRGDRRQSRPQGTSAADLTRLIGVSPPHRGPICDLGWTNNFY